jgi:hypothetical protein
MDSTSITRPRLDGRNNHRQPSVGSCARGELLKHHVYIHIRKRLDKACRAKKDWLLWYHKLHATYTYIEICRIRSEPRAKPPSACLSLFRHIQIRAPRVCSPQMRGRSVVKYGTPSVLKYKFYAYDRWWRQPNIETTTVDSPCEGETTSRGAL